MSVRDEFFAEVLRDARLMAEEAVVAATDPITLKSAGLTEEATGHFIRAIKPIASTVEFRAYSELAILLAYARLFASIEGITATYSSRVTLVDDAGVEISQSVSNDFIGFLIDQGYKI